jgi:hypothetical protein
MTGIRVLMRRTRLFGCATLVLAGASMAFGQGLNPNPLLPSGVGSASDVDMSRGYGPGGALGRGIGGAGDVNPADTLLKEMDGSNYGRRTGRSTLSDPRRRTSGYRRLASGKVQGTAVRFDVPGAYEEAIYGSRRGSYTNITRRGASR